MRKKIVAIAFAAASLFISCKRAEISIEQSISKESTWKHLEDIQKIADQNKNHRSVGSPGGIATANYIVEQLELSGLKAVRLPFEAEGVDKKKIKGQNIIVDIPGKSSDIVFFGAHYDSVENGPGINDNATGVAILLEIASVVKKKNIQPEKTIRIAFWDAEESGVVGSADYIKSISEEEKKKISSYVNVDMVGTKDSEILILDGDRSSIQPFKDTLKKNGLADKDIEAMVGGIPAAHQGSSKLEKIAESYLKAKNIKYKDDLFTSLSTDTAPFFKLSPTTGLMMTHEILEKDGALLYASCYHQACDNINNVDKKSFDIAIGLISHFADELALKK